jgi:hypothetical protein
VLPSDTLIDFINSEQMTAQLGIIYLPQTYVKNMRSDDQLEQAQTLLKIIHLISKQLSKHWFYNYQECNDHINLAKENNDIDLTTETIYFMKNFCSNKTCLSLKNNRNNNLFLKYNQNCYLFKGIVNWIGYLAFQSIKPDLFDLVIFYFLFSFISLKN